jgi:hypothetical protein
MGKLLFNIHADDLAEECMKHAEDFDKSSFERTNAYVVYLLSILASLSVDIEDAINEEAANS